MTTDSQTSGVISAYNNSHPYSNVARLLFFIAAGDSSCTFVLVSAAGSATVPQISCARTEGGSSSFSTAKRGVVKSIGVLHLGDSRLSILCILLMEFEFSAMDFLRLLLVSL